MQSSVGTVRLPVVGSPPNTIGAFYTGDGDLPVRLYIRNPTGVGVALLAYDSSALNGAAGGSVAGTFRLGTGEDVVFILQPRQRVFGVGLVVGVTISFHASVALPIGGVP